MGTLFASLNTMLSSIFRRVAANSPKRWSSSLMVRTFGFEPKDPGSIPGWIKIRVSEINPEFLISLALIV
jgi:hypothetical protein